MTYYYPWVIVGVERELTNHNGCSHSGELLRSADRCGAQSTLLTAIDKDTKTAYLHAVGHANGTSTVIKGLGKLPTTFSDPVYFLRTTDTSPQLFGE